MEKNKLKELIIGHKSAFLSRRNLVKREVQIEINRYISQKEIILITGVRRSGKSSLLKLIFDDLTSKIKIPVNNILYLNFEDERFIDFTVEDFQAVYELFLELENPADNAGKVFFLDEIQNIKGWERWVNRVYEFEDVKFFITGSNSSLLGSDISSALTGRNRQIVNLPYSFYEYLTFKGFFINDKTFYESGKRSEIKRLFNEYLNFGGFPEVANNSDTSILEQYYKDIIYRDVISRRSIKNAKEIKELALYLSSNIGTVQSYNNIKNLIGVKSVNTVKNYFEALSEVFLFFFIDLFDFSVKKQIYNPSKVYSIDIALSKAVSFKFSQNTGHYYENIVFLELKRKNEDIYYWKSKKGVEVDFITRKGIEIDKAVQVTTSLSNKKIKEREIKGLIESKEYLRPRSYYIITEDEEGIEKAGDIEINIVPLWKWCLSRPL